MKFDFKKFENSNNDFGYYKGMQKSLLQQFIHFSHTWPLYEIHDGKYDVEKFDHYVNNIENFFQSVADVKLLHSVKTNSNIEEWTLVSDEIFIGLVSDNFHKNLHFNAYSSNKNLLEAAFNLFDVIEEKKEIKETIYVLTEKKGQLGASSLSNIKFNLEKGNYNDSILEDYEYILEEYNKEKPFGRIAIFSGPAGTGKTHLVKSLATSIENCTTIFIPIGLAPYLDKPSFMDFLLNFHQEQDTDSKKGFLFIIEDADQILINRSQGDYSLLSAFLNFTDGLIGDCLNVRFLATTNSDFLTIDDAFKRPGRLLRYSNVDLLTPEKAAQVYKRLSNSDKTYKEAVSLAQVYADTYSKMNGIVEKKKQVLGFGAK